MFGAAEDAARFRSWTNFGFSGTHEAQVVGINAKMSEIQCAYVHAALDGWADERSGWSKARASVVAMLDDLEVQFFSASRAGINPYVIACFSDGERAIAVERGLAAHSTETRRWWSNGCHTMPGYRKWATSEYPVSEHAAATFLGLPFYRGMAASEIFRIREALSIVLADRG